MQISVIKAASYVATQIDDDLSWGIGSIQPQQIYAKPEDHKALIEAVLQSIQPVAKTEIAYSACTDGRLPVKLLNGETIPVREQMVGADLASAFFAAEILGDEFYTAPHAPVNARLREVAEFLKQQDLLVSSHIACGAAAGFTAIMRNFNMFAATGNFEARVKELLPEGIYNQKVFSDITTTASSLGNSNNYSGLSVEMFLEVASTVSGRRAVAELADDGRGIQGHVEEAIVRVRIPGHAINEANVAELTDRREVFGVNNMRIERIARIVSRGNEQRFRTAYLALEMFADAGHATLAKNLPTWIVTAT